MPLWLDLIEREKERGGIIALHISCNLFWINSSLVRFKRERFCVYVKVKLLYDFECKNVIWPDLNFMISKFYDILHTAPFYTPPNHNKVPLYIFLWPVNLNLSVEQPVHKELSTPVHSAACHDIHVYYTKLWTVTQVPSGS